MVAIQGVINFEVSYFLIFFLVAKILRNGDEFVIRWVWQETVGDLVFLLKLNCRSVLLPVAD
jgi:hypothetical protein